MRSRRSRAYPEQHPSVPHKNFGETSQINLAAPEKARDRRAVARSPRLIVISPPFPIWPKILVELSGIEPPTS